MQTQRELHLKRFRKPQGSNNQKKMLLLRSPQIVSRDGRYVAYDNGIICDCYSNTEWYPGPNRDISWLEADRWVRSLTVCGGSWTLPTIEQLKNLYCKNKKGDRITPLLSLQATDVWSIETPDDSTAWGFNFIPGNSFSTYRTYSTRFRTLATRPKPHYHMISQVSDLQEYDYQADSHRVW